MSVNSLELDYQIKEFDLYRRRESKIFKEKKRIQERFVKDFPSQKIIRLKLDEYIQGKGSKKSFCYRLETGLVKLGNMKGATSNKFGVYFGKYGQDDEDKYRFTEKYGSAKEEALKNVKQSIIDLLNAGKKYNREEINNSVLAPLLRFKLLATYFPEKYLNIYANEHLDYFLSELGINISSNEMYDKQIALMDYKKHNKITSRWSNNEFNSFLYHTFGKPPTNEEEKTILEALPALEKVKAELLDYKNIYKNKSQINNKIGKNNYKQDYKNQNDRNNRLGLRGENIVYQFEKKFFEGHKFSVNKLKHVSKKDDRLGYDILSLDEKGKQKFIEVKATRGKPDIANFIITSNEKEKAESLKNYYIYIVFEANTLHPKIMQIKSPFNYSDKMNITPINYRVVFNIKRT